MNILLIPGLWLDDTSWDDVIPALEAAGHATHPLTMPGLGEPGSTVGMSDWVDAVVAEIDRFGGPVALVGHSGGGNVVYGAADARPDAVEHIVFVDTFPPTDGSIIWDEFEVVDGVVPFPGWDAFDDDEVADLDAETRARIERVARTVPGSVPTDQLTLRDERRREVPATMISCIMSAAELTQLIDSGPDWVAEVAALENLEIVDLPGGHWPQFAQPTALGEKIVEALAR